MKKGLNTGIGLKKYYFIMGKKFSYLFEINRIIRHKNITQNYFTMDKLELYLQKIIELGIEYAPKLLLAILTLVIGAFIIKRLVKVVKKIFRKRDVEVSLRDFLISIIRILLWVMLIIAVAGMVGIETTSFIAVLGAAGLAIGLALQGSLANFAGGVLILLFKPFKVGDVIEAQGFLGTADSISIFHTEIRTFDNRIVVLPNGNLANGAITNITREDVRRVDMEFGIGYGDDIDKAKSILKELAQADERIFKDPEPVIVLGSLGDSSVNFKFRVWSKKEDYWDIYFEMQENVKKRFDKEGISIPFPQTDVHLFNEKA
jgi:small conductance mechanosensitive channel